MKKQPAALAAALLLCLPLMGAARTTGSLSSALLSKPSSAQAAARPSSASAGVAVSWAVQPAVQCDGIYPLQQYRGSGDEDDFNARRNQTDDGLLCINRNGKKGLIDSAGREVVPSVYTEIAVGYDARYLLTDDVNASFTLNNGRTVALSEQQAMEIGGTAPEPVLVWVPMRSAVYRNGGADASLDTVYTRRVPVAAEVVTGLGSYDTYTSAGKMVLTDGAKPVSGQQYDGAGAYSSGLIPMKKNGKWGYLDAAGKTVIPFQYDACWDRYPGETTGLPFNASYGTVVLCRGGRYSLADTAGNVLIPEGTYEKLCPVYKDTLWASQNGTWGVLKLSKALAATQTGLGAPAAGGSKTAVTTADHGLILRSGPGSGYARLAVIPKGTAVVLQDSRDGWYKVQYNGRTGWVSGQYLTVQG